MFVQRKYLRGKRGQADLVSRVEMPSVVLEMFYEFCCLCRVSVGLVIQTGVILRARRWYLIITSGQQAHTGSPRQTRVYGPCCGLNGVPPPIHILKA